MSLQSFTNTIRDTFRDEIRRAVLVGFGALRPDLDDEAAREPYEIAVALWRTWARIEGLPALYSPATPRSLVDAVPEAVDPFEAINRLRIALLRCAQGERAAVRASLDDPLAGLFRVADDLLDLGLVQIEILDGVPVAVPMGDRPDVLFDTRVLALLPDGGPIDKVVGMGDSRAQAEADIRGDVPAHARPTPAGVRFVRARVARRAPRPYDPPR